MLNKDQNQLGRKKILIVDDDKMNQYMLKKILDDGGYSVFQTSNGVDAINIAKNNSPDLIILDIVMPGMDGRQVASILRMEPETKDIPIFFLSSLELNETERDSFTKKGIGFVPKPYKKDRLLAYVKNCLNRNKVQEI